MPEILEIERYRRLAERVQGRTVTAIDAPDDWYLKGGLTAPMLRAAVAGARVERARRRGKVLLLDLGPRPGTSVGDGPVLGLRFGMTGHLLVDGEAGVEELEYGPPRVDPAWDRLVLRFAEGGELRVNDARRLGGVALDPDEDALGPDALSVTPAQLGAVLDGERGALKARLMDQARLAGVGNLLADETLWRAGLDPARPAGSLDTAERRRLLRALRTTLTTLGERGGSHTGDLQAARVRGGRCPRRRAAGAPHRGGTHHVLVPSPPALRVGALEARPRRRGGPGPGIPQVQVLPALPSEARGRLSGAMSRPSQRVAALLLGLAVVAGPALPAAAQTRTTASPRTTVEEPTTLAPTTTAALPTATFDVPTVPTTVAADVGDDAAARTVRRIIAALLALALLVGLVTYWYWRRTKPVPAPLVGLAEMGSRRWQRAHVPVPTGHRHAVDHFDDIPESQLPEDASLAGDGSPGTTGAPSGTDAGDGEPAPDRVPH